MNYVIIGNGTAATGAIEGIRVVDKDGPITLISSEPYPVYGRPLISYLLLGKTTEEKMLRYRQEDFYEKNGVTLCSARRPPRSTPRPRRSRWTTARWFPMTSCASPPARARSSLRWKGWIRSQTRPAS